MNEQLLETSGANVLSLRKKLRKTLWGSGTHPLPPAPLLVRPRVKKNQILKTEDPERNCIQGTTRKASWVIVQFAKYQRIYDIPRCPGAEKM